MPTSVAVTGATGLIGCHLVDSLLANGSEVRVLTRRPHVARAMWSNGVDVWAGDLTDRQSLKGFMDGVKILYHVAGEVRDAHLFNAVNVVGTYNLLRECIGKPLRRLIHFSSVAAIGPVASGIVNELTVCRPRSGYEISKKKGEDVALEFHHKDGVPATVVRATIVFGARQVGQEDAFVRWVKAIQSGRFHFVGREHYVANYIYVEDLVSASVRLAEREKASGEVYIVSDSCRLTEFVRAIAEILDVKLPTSGIPLWIAYSVASILQGCGALMGFSPPITFRQLSALTNRAFYSSAKIERDLSFKPPLGYREGLRRTICSLDINPCFREWTA